MFGFTELLLCAAIAALLFGGRRIAQLGSDLGRSAGVLKRDLQARRDERLEQQDPTKPGWVNTAADVVETARDASNATKNAKKFPFS